VICTGLDFDGQRRILEAAERDAATAVRIQCDLVDPVKHHTYRCFIIPGLVNPVNSPKKRWKDPAFPMGKSTIKWINHELIMINRPFSIAKCNKIPVVQPSRTGDCFRNF
jgi:hypothetical protein